MFIGSESPFGQNTSKGGNGAEDVALGGVCFAAREQKEAERTREGCNLKTSTIYSQRDGTTIPHLLDKKQPGARFKHAQVVLVVRVRPAVTL